MIPYILHVSILLTGCFLFYQLLLKRETFFQLNRWVLVGSIILSFLFPLYEVPQEWSLKKMKKPVVTSVVYENTSSGIIVTNKNRATEEKIEEVVTPMTAVTSSEPQLTIWQVLKYIYLTGLLIFIINFVVQIVLLLRAVWTYPNMVDNQFRIIELPNDKAPYSFWNMIFINPSKYDWDTYSQIIEHEKIHITERHTIDILLAEIMVAIQWFNPFAWWFRKAVENNLEYRTDQRMLLNGTNREAYQFNLLKISVPEFPLNLTTNYNQSFLKKRIVMMDAKKSSARSTWKYLFFLPLMGLSLITLNSVKVTAALPIETLFTEAIPSNIDPDEEDLIPTEGLWNAEIVKNQVCFKFNNANSNKGTIWYQDACFTKTAIANLPTNKGKFSIVRSAGTLHLDGTFEGNNGNGSYTFEADDSFNNIIEKWEEEVPTSLVFAFFLIDLNETYITYLEQNFEDLDFGDMEKLAHHRILLDDIQKMKKGLTDIGFNEVGLENLAELIIHDVSTVYIQSLGRDLYQHLDIEQIIEAKIHDVQPDYIRQFRTAGYKDIDFETIVEFAIHDVDLDYIKSLKDEGLGDLTSDQIVEAAIHKVSPNYIKKFKAAGYDNIDFETIVAFATHDVSLDYIESLHKAGFTNLNNEQIIEAAIHKVNPNYIKQFQQADFADMDMDDIIRFAIHDVDLAYINSLEAAGLNDLSQDEITEAAIHNVNPSFINQYKTAGYSNLPFEQLMELAIHQISVSQINALQKAGYGDLSIETIIEAGTHGVDSDYLKEVKTFGISKLDMKLITQFAMHGVDKQDITEYRSLGYDNLSAEELLQLHIHEADYDYIYSLNQLGFKNIGIEELIECKIHDVDADFINQMKEEGKTGLSLQAYKQLKIKENSTR